MRTIITINENQAQRGNYTYSIKRPNQRVSRKNAAGYGCQAAAATAVDLAMGCDEYVILADDKVMGLIPKEIKNK